MNSEWQDFLTDNGAEMDGGQVTSFGNVERERQVALSGDVMCELSQYKLLAIVGTDAKTFLQGQLTNDTALLDNQTSQLNSFCTPKGRAISNFRLFQSDETLLAIIPHSTFDLTLTKLQPYILRAQVQLGDASSALIQFGVSGDKAEQQLKQYVGELPESNHQVIQKENLVIIKIADQRYHILGNYEECTTLWSHLDVHCAAVSHAQWELLNIRDGIPEITDKTTELFVPQMLNLDVLEAISFTKGCYTGQEIVARTHYLGKQKRRTYRIHIETDTVPHIGDELKTDASNENQYTGTLVNVQPDAGDGYEALAVIQIKSAETETLKLAKSESKIEIGELPYSLDSEAEN